MYNNCTGHFCNLSVFVQANNLYETKNQMNFASQKNNYKMAVINNAENIRSKVEEKEHPEELEQVNNKRKLQNKVLQKIVENLNNQGNNEPILNKKKR